MGYAVFQNKVYTYRIPRYHASTTIILDDKLCGKTVLIDECTLIPHVNIRVKYQSEWYSILKHRFRDHRHLTLLGPKQEGFHYQYDAGGYPIYAKDVSFPDDILDAVIQVTELRQSGKFVDSFYKLTIDKYDWISDDLVICILTEIFIDRQYEKVPVDYVS